jgi:hypothetical protein
MEDKITQDDRDFVNQLFNKLITHVDMDMLDLNDEDCCHDEFEFRQIEEDFIQLELDTDPSNLL